MKKLIEFKNVHISLGNEILFEDISFSIYEGERFMLTGKNGSGKSLLLELIALGYTNDLKSRYKGLVVTGHIYDENGQDLLDPKTERSISYVTQTEDFYRNSTLYKEAEIACHGSGQPLNEDKLDQLLEAFELTRKKHQKLKNNLSLGEGKLVHLLTRILQLGSSKILLLDEPLNHLSFRNSKFFNDIMLQEIANNPALTIVMVSHCRAISFVNKAMQYNYTSACMEEKKYKSYDCFE